MYIKQASHNDLTEAWQTQTEFNKTLLRNALAAAIAYQGDQASYDQVINELDVLETAIKAQNVNALPLVQAEKQFLQSLGLMNVEHVSISGMLDWAQKNCDSYIADIAKQPEQLAKAIATVNLSLVFVSPEPQMVVAGTGEGEFEHPRYEPRLASVLQEIIGQEFNGRRINRDELIIYLGQVRANMMRQEPYQIIEIPLLGKQIAVCDQVGEAMFVSHRLLQPIEWGTFSKTALVDQIGCTRIIMDDDWRVKLNTSLNALNLDTNFTPPSDVVALQKEIGERQKAANAKRVTITNSILNQFIGEQNRTGVKAVNIHKLLAHDIASQISVVTMDTWVKGESKTCIPEIWQSILAEYAKLPSVSPTINTSDAMRADSIKWQKDTDVKFSKLLSSGELPAPAGLTAEKLRNWVRTKPNGSWAASTCIQAEWDWVKNAYENLVLIPLKDEMVNFIIREQERTGIYDGGIIGLLGAKKRHGLSEGIVRCLKTRSGNLRRPTIKKAYWEAIRNCYADQPDKPDGKVYPVKGKGSPTYPNP